MVDMVHEVPEAWHEMIRHSALTNLSVHFSYLALKFFQLVDTAITFYQKDSHSTFYLHPGVFLEES